MRLYHRTTRGNADAILETRRWRSRENTQEVFFSTVPDGQTDGYGDVVLYVDVDNSTARLDDEFPDGEQHYAVRITHLHGLLVSEYR